jgi:hypothetical protein
VEQQTVGAASVPNGLKPVGLFRSGAKHRLVRSRQCAGLGQASRQGGDRAGGHSALLRNRGGVGGAAERVVIVLLGTTAEGAPGGGLGQVIAEQQLVVRRELPGGSQQQKKEPLAVPGFPHVVEPVSQWGPPRGRHFTGRHVRPVCEIGRG